MVVPSETQEPAKLIYLRGSRPITYGCNLGRFGRDSLPRDDMSEVLNL